MADSRMGLETAPSAARTDGGDDTSIDNIDRADAAAKALENNSLREDESMA